LIPGVVQLLLIIVIVAVIVTPVVIDIYKKRSGKD